MANPVREFFGGVGVLLRGFAVLLRKPRLFLLGALPALITSVLFLTLFVLLVVNLTDLVGWATPFADGWDPVWQGLLQGAVSIAVLAGAVLLMVVAFTTVTLTLGAPVYDRITELVEEELGNAPQAPDESLMASVWRSVHQSLAIVAMSLLVTVFVFVIGFIPLAGQVVGLVSAALLGGWLLAIELVAGAFDRRGMLTIRERHQRMRTRRMRVLGFAVPTYLLLAIPFVAVAVFPAATAGGAILTRDLVPTAPSGLGSGGAVPGPGTPGGPVPGGPVPGQHMPPVPQPPQDYQGHRGTRQPPHSPPPPAR